MTSSSEEVLKVGLTRPVNLETWWEFKGYPFAVNFHLTGWGFNSGPSGRLHIGPVGQSEPICVCMSDMVFVELVNEGKLVRIDSPQGQ